MNSQGKRWIKRKKRPSVTKDGRTILRGREYTAFRHEMWESQARLCARCQSYTRIDSLPEMDFSFHVHHKAGRGMGGSKRDDTFLACEGLCGKCHRKEHNQ